MNRDGIFQRVGGLLGTGAMQRLADIRVLLIGVGGVGSWCAEALIRTGVTHLTMADHDKIVPSNCNRQLHATSSTIGRLKVDVMKQRLLDINPLADITTLPLRFTETTAESFHLADYDVVVDAIDSLTDKGHLILYVTHLTSSLSRPILISSMGAARRVDPTQVRVAEFWQVKGDPLAALLRKRFRRMQTFPHCKFNCVFSLETPQAAEALEDGAVNSSLCHVTATFGMALAAEVLKTQKSAPE